VTVDAFLEAIPPMAVYLIVGVVIGLESLGIPLPGEIALVGAALLASRDTLDISPLAVGLAATLGAIVGDTIGYGVGRRYGMGLFERLSRRFPNHFGPGHVALAKRLFARWGVWAVLLGRFVAAAHPRRPLGRCAANGLSQVPRRQRPRRTVLGGPRRYGG
jgi:membrane protein DedA with SNARE-associated domain